MILLICAQKSSPASRYLQAVRPVVRNCTSSTAVSQKSHKTIGYWLLGCSGMVFGAVVLGAGYSLMVMAVCEVLAYIVELSIK